MSRNVDFAIVLRGGVNGVPMPFNLQKKENLLIDTKPYLEKAKNPKRHLVEISTGSGKNIDQEAQQLLEFIRINTGGRLGDIGAFCIVGSSNGCALVLALCAELKKAGAPKLNYVGVADVPIMPFGRDPAITGVGKLQSFVDPEFAKLKNNLSLGPFAVKHPDVSDERPPLTRLLSGADVNAQAKRNFFQKKGNHVRYLVQNHPTTGSNGWWWWSGMGGGEVHGELETFENKQFDASGKTDQNFHDDLCDSSPAKPFGQMLSEASLKLAEFPV